MVDAVVTVFLEKLINALSERTRIVTKFREQFENLRDELLLMQSFLQDADRLKRKHQTLRIVMLSLRDLVLEAEDILSDCPDETEYDGKVSRWFSNFPSRYQTGKRLREINEKIELIKQRISSYLGVQILDRTKSMEKHILLMTRWSSPQYDHSQVVGLESDTEKIIDWVFEANEGILAIGIVGMGGLGKTTIAQKVFNDRRVENHFERRIWVSVTQSFTEEQIMRSILRSLGDACVGDDHSTLLNKINMYLIGKKYLIVMDDVWSTDNTWWLRIYEGLPKGNGSSVMITTRNKKVVRTMGVGEPRIHWPKFLSESNSWLLFRKIAFAATGGVCPHSELENVGKEIVEKCKGLPLAIKAVGGVMLCKPPYYHEWRRISDRFRDELIENDNSVMASLQLSYDELPPYLKYCFLCFSLYPEDCEISKEQLIYWWIGESFIPLKNGRLSTQTGEDCFKELTNRCLIEVVDKAYNGTIYTCKIHDMVRDLVIQIAEDDAFSLRQDADCRHLSIGKDMNLKYLATNNKLRALLTTTRSGEVNKIASSIAKKFNKCQHLQVFDLSKSLFKEPLTSLLDEIGSLQRLNYLSLSNTHPLTQIPLSLEKLNTIQILDVSYCQNLKMLPSCITTFKKLIALDVSHCGSLEYFPKGIGNLLNLQVLLGFKPAKPSQTNGSRIAELRNLSQLKKLGLRLTHGEDVGSDEVDALVNLHELQYLTISCFESYDDSLISKLENLYPPQQLHELSLNFFPGKKSPVWLNPMALPVLCFLSICCGNVAKMNERFWGDENNVWRIEGLKLEALLDLGEDWTTMQRVMPCLRILNVSWCPELESFPVEDAGYRGGMWKKEEERS